jgi:hypothetical protein
VPLVVIHSTDGKIVAAFRPRPGEGKHAEPVLLEGQHLFELSDEPDELASLSLAEIGRTHVVDHASGQLVRR